MCVCVCVCVCVCMLISWRYNWDYYEILIRICQSIPLSSQQGRKNTPTASLQRCKIPQFVCWIRHLIIRQWGSHPGTLGTFTSTLTRSGSKSAVYTWNHLTVYKQMNSDLFKNVTYKLFVYRSYIYIYIYIYIYKYSVSIYIGPMWLLIILLIIMVCSFFFRFEKSFKTVSK